MLYQDEMLIGGDNLKYYDIHSHLGKTSSGEENTPTELVEDLKKHGITKVGISCLSGISTRYQNDFIYKSLKDMLSSIQKIQKHWKKLICV